MAAELAIKITADGKAVVTAAKQAETALQGVSAQAGQTSQALQGTSHSSEGLEAAMRKLDQSSASSGAGLSLLGKGAGMAATAIVAAGAAVASGFVAKLVAVQREFDVLNSSLVTVSGSSAAAAREMAWLKDFAKDTPYGLAQATQGFVKMKALGLEPTRSSLTSFGNTASAMGKDLNQMVEAVADAATGEFERLKEFGIKAKQEGDKVSLTFQGVTQTIGNNAAEITQYLTAIGNVEFAGAMAERAKTLDGTLSGLADSWDELFRTIGASGVSQAVTNEIKGVDNYLVALTDHMNAAKAAGAGMAGELSSGLGYIIARAPFDVLSGSANLLNGTLNLLTGGAMRLNTSVNLLPDSFKTTEQQAVALAAKLKEAEAEFARLRAESDKRGSNIYIQSELAALATYITKLKEAQAQKAALTGGADPREGQPSMTRGASYARWDKEQADSLAALSGERMKAAGVNKEFIASVKIHQDALRLGTETEKEATAAIAGLVKKRNEGTEAGKAAAKAEKAGAAGAQAAVSQYNSLMLRMDERLALSAQELKAGRQLTDAEKEEAKITALLDSTKNKMGATERSATEARLASVKASEAQVLIQRAGQKATEDANKQRQQYMDATEKETASLQDQIDKQLDHNATIGLSKEAIAELTAQRELDKASTLEALAIKALDRNLDYQQYDATMAKVKAMRELAGAKKTGGALEAADEAAKKATAEWAKFTDSVYNGLTDSLYRAFEKGGSFFRNFWDGIKNLFKTTVLKLAIQGVVGGVAGALGLPGAANAATGGGSNMLGMASNASSLYSSASSLVSMGSQVFAGTMSVANALGTVAANATGTGISGLLATNGAYGTAAVGSASSMAGSAMSALGAIPGWGWAAMAAVAVASIFGGRGKKESTGTGITGTLSASGASVSQYADWKQDGGWFHSDRSGRELSAVGGELQKILDTSVTGVTSATKLYAAALGLSADAVTGFAQDITISLAGLDAKAQQEAIEKALGGFADGMASVYGGITVLSKDGEGASATLARLSTSLVTTNAWLSMLRQRVLQVGLAGADAASKLADTFGGLEQMGSAVQAYYALYFTETERAAYSTQQMTAALAALGIAMPATKDAFRAVADSLDLNTEAGRKAYAVLLTIAPEFAAVADQTAKLAQETATRLLDTFSGRQQLIPLLNTTLARFDALGDGLDGTAASTLNMGNATGWINTRLGDASSGLLFFGDRVTGLTQPLTNAQTKALALATGLTEAQIKAGALTTGAGLLGVSLDATKLKAAALATGMSESQIKALALTAATGTLASQLTATQTKALALATGLTEAQIKAGALTAGMIALGSPLSGAQLAALSLSEQILALKLNASRTVTDIVGLSAALASVNTETFMATMQGVLAKLGDMFSGVLGDINSERIAVRDAALAIINPSVMSKDQIQRGIAGANVGMPTNAALVRANSALVAADAYLDNAKGQLYAAQAKSENTISALNGVMTAQVAGYKSTASFFQKTAVGYQIRVNAGSAPNNDAYGYNAATNRLNGFANTSDATTSGRAYKHYIQAVQFFMNAMTDNGTLAKLQNANAVLASSEKSIADARAAGAAEIAAYKRTFDAATATQTAAVTVARNAQLAYIDSLQNYAIDASKATAKLGKLREETVKYYESQKQLADLMSTSAATLRKTVADYRYSQLTPEQQFRSLETQFNTAYSLALSTSGDTLAGYADQMSALLNPMLEKMQEAGYDPSGSQSAISAYLARAEAIATRVNALTPVNYAADSLAMLGQIDSTLAALEAGSKSAERIISDAINAGRDATVGGLRQVVNALTGRGVTYFADGGAFTNGIATGPTAFNMGMMGEAGPEGILPLTNVGGKLGVHALGGNGNNNAELVAELRALRQDNANMRAELRAIASSNNKTARILDRIEKDGLIVRTDEDTPLSTVAA